MTPNRPEAGKNMNDELIREYFESHAIYALEGYKMYWPEAFSFARALLSASKPAAIDEQEAKAKAAEFMVAARNAQMFQDLRELISTLTDPKANCPGRHLEAQRVLPLLDAFLGDGYTGRVLSFKRALATISEDSK